MRVRQLLSNDHRAVNDLLSQLVTALSHKDVQSSLSFLDLLWARLAVHIRAEHLHLFPAVVNRLAETRTEAGSSLDEARALVEGLRTDHEFFMVELAREIGVLRELTTTNDQIKLAAVGDAVRTVKQRLMTHNQIEENQIYRWVKTLLTEPEQRELASLINSELENRPPRFSAAAWSNYR